MEQVTVLQHASLLIKSDSECNIPEWTEKVCQYSDFLASQGRLSTALLHLQSLPDEQVREEYWRLNCTWIVLHITSADTASFQDVILDLRERITQALRMDINASSKWPEMQKAESVSNASTTVSQVSQQQVICFSLLY